MRENTGLQVALIIFVMITVVLAVVVYWSFTQAQDAARELKEQRSANTTLTASFDKLQVESAQLRDTLGYDTKFEHDKIMANFHSDMIGAGFDPDTMSYPAALTKLNERSTKLSGDVVLEKDRADRAEGQLATLRSQFAAKERELLAGQQKASDDLAKMTTDYTTRRQDLVTRVDGIQKEFEDFTKQSSAETAAKVKEIDALTTQIGTLHKRNEILIEKIDAVQGNTSTGNSERPDGKVMYVNQRGGMVSINLGSDHGLIRGTMFTVYDAGTANIGTTEPKASIEVTTIRSANQSEARIIEDTLSNPILQQDVVYSPVWNPGQKTHFALVGFMDIDQDGKSDRRLIRTLIEQNGGAVDAEVTDEGSRDGKLSINTRYLVQGERATDKSSAETIAQSTRMIQEASELGIETISVERLLSDMGWRGSERTVGGRGASGGDFKAQPKEPTDLGPKSPFQQRTRPGTQTRRGSAY